MFNKRPNGRNYARADLEVIARCFKKRPTRRFRENARCNRENEFSQVVGNGGSLISVVSDTNLAVLFLPPCSPPADTSPSLLLAGRAAKTRESD